MAALYAVLTVATFRMLEIVHDEKSPILQIPGSVTYGCVMGGMAMLAVLALFSAWRVWQTSEQPARVSGRVAADAAGPLVDQAQGERHDRT